MSQVQILSGAPSIAILCWRNIYIGIRFCENRCRFLFILLSPGELTGNIISYLQHSFFEKNEPEILWKSFTLLSKKIVELILVRFLFDHLCSLTGRASPKGGDEGSNPFRGGIFGCIVQWTELYLLKVAP